MSGIDYEIGELKKAILQRLSEIMDAMTDDEILAMADEYLDEDEDEEVMDTYYEDHTGYLEEENEDMENEIQSSLGESHPRYVWSSDTVH